MEQLQCAGRPRLLPRHGWRERPRGAWRLASGLGLGLFLASAVLSACADASASAQREKTRLDKAMQAVRTNLNVPDGLLQPIVAQELRIAASTKSGSDETYQAATAGYTKLYNQVVAIEHATPQQAHAQAQTDMQQLTAAQQQVQKQGFAEAAQYQQRIQQAQQQLDAATTAKDYFTVDSFIQAQTAAVQKIEPVNQQLQSLNALVDVQNNALGIVSPTPRPLQCARGDTDAYFWPSPSVTITPPQAQGAPTYEYQQWPEQNLAQFRAAGSEQQYDALSALMSAQTQQLAADAAAAAPPQAQRLVQAFQADVQTYQQNGGKDGSFQQQAAQDAQALGAAKSLADYGALVQALLGHRQAMALPLLQAQAQHDFQELRQLVDKAQNSKTIDPANGQPYPNGYEYASGGVGIGDAEERLANSKTLDDFQAVDAEIQMFITNIQAMLQNLDDKTPPDQPHQTDLSLLQHYGIANTRVIVVSLREQMSRMYDSGKLVKAFKTTTGNPDLPSPPGVHCVLAKLENYFDVSPFAPGSAYYYNPTHINYGMIYSDYGFIVHDAWWRGWFGKYSNLPHYEPISFNNGSHGCINYPLGDMSWLYQWSQVGTPVLVY